MDGVVGGLPATAAPTPLSFVVNVPAADVGTVLALVGKVGARISPDDTPDIEADFEKLSHTAVATGSPAEFYDLTVVGRLPRSYWRDKVETTSAAASLASASVVTNVFAGISAPVQDAIVRVKGSATGLRVTDGGGSWFEYPPNIPAANYLRFHLSTMRAYVTTTDTWTGGTEVTGDVDFNGPRGQFELTSYFSNPTSRVARLTVTTTARSGATIEVRGKAAYLA
ncbi:hypothetical protein ACFWGP_05335 [Agromyces sp. NPDC127015]|uniref:hypothetical protein n=1 Tax=Agromyces sp. NPDC127015 TaxID=3347108 RepID=UPI00364F65BF